ncbi:MAG: transcription-repair coupling factor, partial [Hyphomicrobiales bacterium]|nr:transcription-repair coupling factor [Hyphomicrobiales bacterium]
MTTPALSKLKSWLGDPGTINLGGVPDGYESLVLAEGLAELCQKGSGDGDGGGGSDSVVFIARDGQRAADVEAAFEFFAPWAEVLHVPAWDCLPYDRVSPSNDVLARRISALATLASGEAPQRPRLITLTPNALMQRLPSRAYMGQQVRDIRPGQSIDTDDLVNWLTGNGFQRTPTVRDAGEFAVRGGIIDLFAPGNAGPVRLDFFGDTLETLREFDVQSQRTTRQLTELQLVPMSEVTLDPNTIARFRTNYLTSFGAATRDDALYTAVSEGRRYAGLEHWLPLFFEELETIFHYLGDAPVFLDHLVADAVEEREKQIVDHYEARKRGLDVEESGGAAPYKPVEVE